MSHDVFWPGTAIPKTHHNAFNVACWDMDPAWGKMAVEDSAKAKQAEGRKIKPPKPITISTRHQPRAARRLREGMTRGRAINPNSSAGQIRKLLEAGPLSRKEIAERTGLSYSGLAGLMKHDIKHGRIVVIAEPGNLQRFAVPESE